jgi:predicted metal-dependent HD superfamily phosphohydrolase
VAPQLSEVVAQEFLIVIGERYSEPWRFYHTARHLGDVVGFLVENVAQLRNPRATLWAAFGHDEIYIPQAPVGVNEELSAQLSEARYVRRLPKKEIRLVGSYIRSTANHARDGEDKDLAFFLDADLKILGAPAEEFDEYDANIRSEYSFVPTEVYKNARTHALKNFYDQNRLFVTDTAYELYELTAKSNLERKLDELADLS